MSCKSNAVLLMVNPQKLSEFVMAIPQQKPRFPQARPSEGQVSPLESANYTGELLESLRKIAAGQGQAILAHLLELARSEARMIARDQKLSQATAPFGAPDGRSEP